MQRASAFISGFIVASLLALGLLSSALYHGDLVRGDAPPDISGYLPKVVREAPYKRAGDTIGGIIARAE